MRGREVTQGRTGQGRGRARKWTLEEAEEVLSEWKRSGLAGAEFARRRGISEKRLWYWLGKLRRLGVEPGGRGKLLPVRVVEGSLGYRGGGVFEVCLKSGVVVRVPMVFDEGSLRKLLRVLEG